MKIKKREAKEEAIFWGGELTQEISEFFAKRLWQSVKIEDGKLQIITPSRCRYMVESSKWIICNSLDEEMLFMPNEDFKRYYFIVEDEGVKESPVIKAEGKLNALTFRAETKQDAINIAMPFLDSGGYQVIIKSVKEFVTSPFFKIMYEIRAEVIT